MAALTAEQRFHSGYIPVPETGCWLWEKSAVKSHNQEYGELKVNGKRKLTHRYSYELHIGSIPEGMQVCHKCDVGVCVNPEHLFLGSNRDNQLDMVKKGRQGNQKLSESDVRNIRIRLANREVQHVIASEYNVAQQTINDIATGKRWSHLEN